MNVKKMIFVVSIGVIIGFIVGFIIFLNSIIVNQYIWYKMFRLVAFSLQKSLNKWVLLSIIISFALFIFVTLFTFIVKLIWKLFFSNIIEVHIKDKNKARTILLTCVVCSVFFFYNRWAINHYLLTDKFHLISLLGNVGILFLVIFLRWVLTRVKWDTLSNLAKYSRRIGCVLIVVLLLLNLSIFVDSKINVPQGPNVILIYFDALRPDHLGCYGYSRDTSANIDYLARTGILFKNAFSQSAGTYPSVHSSLTSKYASHFFSTKNPSLEKRHLTLAEALKNNGYYTIAVSSSPVVTKTEIRHFWGGFEQGFDIFDKSAYKGEKKWNWKWRSPEGVIEKSLVYLNKNYRKKFFLLLYIMDPHSVYHSPEPYNSLYDPDYVGKEDVIKGFPAPYEKDILRGINTDLNNRDIKHLIALYDGEITYADAQIGKLLERLHQLNLINNTLIVLMSDHGEEFFEHGGLKHGYTLYNELIKVPLIFSYPGFNSRGIIIDQEIVQSIDVVPTILNIANINKPETMQGETLLPLIKKRNVKWRKYALSEIPSVDAKAIITKEWKYIHHFETKSIVSNYCDKYRKGKELYNLQEDKMEIFNLYFKKPEIVKKLYSQMMDILPDCERKRIEKSKNIELDRKAIEKLKSLGYLQ